MMGCLGINRHEGEWLEQRMLISAAANGETRGTSVLSANTSVGKKHNHPEFIFTINCCAFTEKNPCFLYTTITIKWEGGVKEFCDLV